MNKATMGAARDPLIGRAVKLVGLCAEVYGPEAAETLDARKLEAKIIEGSAGDPEPFYRLAGIVTDLERVALIERGRANGDGHDPDAPDAEREPEQQKTSGSSSAGPWRFDPSAVVSVSVLVEEGRRLIAEGVRFVLQGVIPDYGVVGFIVGYAKVGKSTFGIALAGAIARGAPFMGLEVTKRRVLYLALEDPREYIAWMLARSMRGDEDAVVYPRALVLNDGALAELEAYVKAERIGFLYVATFMAGIRGLVKDENDNVGMAAVVEALKGFARRVGVPVLIEAHSGKGEDAGSDADPVRALRGASAAAGAADFILSLKRDGRGMTTRRVLSGGGRFVSFPPIVFDYDPETGQTTSMGSPKTAAAETTWRLIAETGAVVGELRSLGAIVTAAGMADNGRTRDQVRAALDRQGVERVSRPQGSKTLTFYRLTDPEVIQ